MAEADVFISYSRRDQKRVLDFAERLRDAGVSVWIDQGGIEAATKWSQSIVQAIEGCQVFLLVASETSFASENVVKEVSLASESGKHILPVYLEPLTPPASMRYQLAGIQHVELFGKNEERAYESILGSLEKLVGEGKKLARGGEGAAQRKKKKLVAGGALVAVLAAAGIGAMQYVKGGELPPSIRLVVPAEIELEGRRMALWSPASDGGERKFLTDRVLDASASSPVVFETAAPGADAVAGSLQLQPGATLQAELLGTDDRLLARTAFSFTGDPGFQDEALDSSPAILIRVPISWVEDTADARMDLLRDGKPVESCALEGAGAVLFGARTADVSSLVDGWKRGKAYEDLEDEKKPVLIDKWSTPLFVALPSLAPDDSLEAVLITTDPEGNERTKGRVRSFKTTSEVLQDHRMEPANS